jgi:hypothetical protein
MKYSYDKKIRYFVMLLVITLLLPAYAAQAEISFSDVDMQQKGWAAGSIYLMAGKQILNGYPDGTFRPDDTISKAEWTSMVYRLFDIYRPNKSANGSLKVNGFSDVPSEHWAYKEISEIYNNSFQWGVYGLDYNGQLTFHPDMKLNRLQLANMLYSYFDTRMIDRRLSPNDVCSVVSTYKDIPVKMFRNKDEYDNAAKADGRLESPNAQSTTSNGVLNTLFMGSGPDDCSFGTDSFSNAQASSLASLQASGIMTANTDGYFRPLDKVTRAEAVTILNRIYNFLKKNYWLSDYLTIELEQTNTGNTQASGIGLGLSSGTSASSGNTTSFAGNGYSNQTELKVQDYFKLSGSKNDQGTITKNVKKDGEIDTAIIPMDYSYLTVDLVSQDKTDMIDLYVNIDGKSTLLKQESLPMVLSVNGVQLVGMRSQQRNTSAVKKTSQATLSVKLDKQKPPTPLAPSTR